MFILHIIDSLFEPTKDAVIEKLAFQHNNDLQCIFLIIFNYYFNFPKRLPGGKISLNNIFNQ